MRIIEIEYTRLARLQSFENIKVRAVAVVDEDEDPDEAFSKLRRWVRTQLKFEGVNIQVLDDEGD